MDAPGWGVCVAYKAASDAFSDSGMPVSADVCK